MKKELSLDECKRIEVDILREFDKFCRKNDIRYSLTYGTLIGCIRHKGFIPWDDDIDVMMPRKDYNKFLELWQDGRYRLVTATKKQKWLPLFSRLTDTETIMVFDDGTECPHGLWVALVAIDNVPDDNNEWNIMASKIRRLMKIINICFDGSNSWKNRVKHFVRIFIPQSSLYKLVMKVERIRSSYEDCPTKFVNTWVSGDWYIPFPSEYLNEFEEKEFEGDNYFVIKEYDKYLRGIYGDYMQYPPVEEQVPAHHFKAYMDI